MRPLRGFHRQFDWNLGLIEPQLDRTILHAGNITKIPDQTTSDCKILCGNRLERKG